LSLGASLVFEQRFRVQAKDFGEENHYGLREEDHQQSQPKWSREEWLAEIIGDTCAEGVG